MLRRTENEKYVSVVFVALVYNTGRVAIVFTIIHTLSEERARALTV